MTFLPPHIASTEERFVCPWFRVHEEKWKGHSSTDQHPFYHIESAHGVLVLAITNQGDIILVRQFRHAIRRMTLEFPAGTIDDRETAEEAATRELLEETGYRSSSLMLLGSGHLMVNRSSAKGFLFVAQDCRKDQKPARQKNEEVLLVSPEEFKELVLTGEFEHIPALALLSLAEWKAGLRFVA